MLTSKWSKIMAPGPITSWQIHGETMETVTDFIFLRSKITEGSDCNHEIKRHLLLGRISSVQLLSRVRLFATHELQHTRPPCPTPTPGVHPNSCASSWWCHAAISSSVVPFSSCPQSLPGSESFPMSQLFAWGGQSTGVWALASLLLIISVTITLGQTTLTSSLGYNNSLLTDNISSSFVTHRRWFFFKAACISKSQKNIFLKTKAII